MNRAERRDTARALARVMRNPRKRARFQALLKAEEDAVPMSTAQANDLLLIGYQSIDAVLRGQGRDSHVHSLALISNMTMLLAEQGYGADAMPEILRGQDAVTTCGARLQSRGLVGVTGPEATAIRTLLDIHDQQLHAQPTTGDMRTVCDELRRRIADGNFVSLDITPTHPTPRTQ